MGEEQKPEEKKPEEAKKTEEVKKTEEEKPKAAEKAANKNEKKNKEGEKKEGGGDGKDSGKDGKEEEKAAPPPPPPPAEIVMRVYMHCEGCARKVKKSLRGFNGVEDVVTDCKNHTVVVKGEKADPLKVVERVQRKSHRHVELLSPIPKPAVEGEKPEKPAEPEPPKEEKKEEPKVVIVVIKVHMHCEACAQEIKRRIERMKEVEVATPDLKSSEVTVKGTFDPPKLVEYVYKKTGKHALIVKQEPAEEPPKEEGEKGKEGKEEKKTESAEEKKGEDKGDAKASEKKEGEGGKETAAAAAGAEAVEEETKVQVDLHRNEFYHYPPKYAMEMYHAYPPQIFSDENPNACSIM